MRLHTVVAAATCLLSLVASGGVAVAGERSLVELLNRAGDYVIAYEDSFRLVVAQEDYMQRRRVSASGPVHETWRLRSDVVFLRIPETTLPFWLLRDVYEVDGAAVRERQDRLERLLLSGPQQGFARARAIADEGARYNLGRAFRNFNIPTLVLAFLHPAVQPRFAFEWTGEATLEGRHFVEIAFRELQPPTLIRGPESHRDLKASGRIWVHDGTDGIVARTELVLDTPGEGTVTRTLLTTEYRPVQALGLWVPVEMRERLQSELVGSRGRSGPIEYVDGQASYSGFRKASVSTQEEWRMTDDKKPEPRP